MGVNLSALVPARIVRTPGSRLRAGVPFNVSYDFNVGLLQETGGHVLPAFGSRAYAGLMELATNRTVAALRAAGSARRSAMAHLAAPQAPSRPGCRTKSPCHRSL